MLPRATTYPIIPPGHHGVSFRIVLKTRSVLLPSMAGLIASSGTTVPSGIVCSPYKSFEHTGFAPLLTFVPSPVSRALWPRATPGTQPRLGMRLVRPATGLPPGQRSPLPGGLKGEEARGPPPLSISLGISGLEPRPDLWRARDQRTRRLPPSSPTRDRRRRLGRSSRSR